MSGQTASPASKKRRLSSTNDDDSTIAAVLSSAPNMGNIHPARLNMAPGLRAAAKRAASGPKDKTKAKQRYLKAKKDRRKARKKAAPRGDKKVRPPLHPSAADDAFAFPEEAALNRTGDGESDGSGSSSDADSDTTSDSDSTSDLEADADLDTTSEAPKLLAPVDVDGNEELEDKASQSPDEDLPKTPEQEEDAEVVGLQRFPAAGLKEKSDPALIRQLGLPEGMSNRTIVDPLLSRPLSEPEGQSIRTRISEPGSDEQEEMHRGGFANVSLSESVRSRLEMLGVSEWFAVQVSVIPSLLSLPHSRSLYRPHAPPRDLCVSAPTGSGKTLAYSVPIVEVLRARQVTRLRALIVLPTRDLVSQVRSTIELIAKGTGLRVATATGQHSFAHEQSQIMNQDFVRPKVDILIATPGRLIDHLDSTAGFTLAHLRFLVIDEADRLLSQSFQEWLRKVLQATEEPASASATEPGPLLDLNNRLDVSRFDVHAGDAPFLSTLQRSGPSRDSLEGITPSVQKLLFSATLTRDPAKIAALGLRNPHYITIQSESNDAAGASHEKFSLPQTLREHMLVTSAQDKPLELLQLLHRPTEPIRKALCFTKSVESAARLVKLVEFFEEGQATRGLARLTVKNFSSELKAGEREKIMSQFGRGEIDLLVCSDLISRGIDLPDVRHVVSYDVPVDAAKYVHRVGRTARANREGDAWTLVEEQEARYFKGLMKTVIRRGKLHKVKPNEGVDPRMQHGYAEALKRLAEHYKRNDEVVN